MRSYGAFWLYTLLRFAMFFALWGIVWVVGVPGLIAAFVALVLSVPLSWFLLARPRQAFARSLEQRVDRRRERSHDLETRLAGGAEGTDSVVPAGDGTAAAADDDAPLPPGVSEAPARDSRKRR